LSSLPPVAKAPGLSCLLSSNGKYLAAMLPNYTDRAKSLLKVFDLDDGTVASEIHTIPAHDLFIVPEEVMWGPTEAEFYIYMKFGNIEEYNAGGNYAAYDLQSHDFTTDGKLKLADLLKYDGSGLPDGFSEPDKYGDYPAWDYLGKSYATKRELDASGKADWIQPTFSGYERTSLAVDRTEFEILIAGGISGSPVDPAEGRDGSNAYAYVVSNDNLMRKLELATNHMPQYTLLYYEGDDLVMAFISDDPADAGNPPWRKIRFPRQQLEQLNVVQAGIEQRIILLLKSTAGETLYLLRTRLG
jgi:hypothetical protein